MERTDWQNVGTAAGKRTCSCRVAGGLNVTARTADDASVKIAATPGNFVVGRFIETVQHLFRRSGVHRPVSGRSGNAAVSIPCDFLVTLWTGGTEPFTLKPGPLIAGVLPAAAKVFPLSLAPGDVSFDLRLGSWGADAATPLPGSQTPRSAEQFRTWVKLHIADADQRRASRWRFGAGKA